MKPDLPSSEHAAAAAPRVWRLGPRGWALLLLGLGASLHAARTGVADLLFRWQTMEEYSYGYLIPFVALFLVWQVRDRLESLRLDGSWWGVALAGCGLSLLALGEFSTITVLINYGLVTLVAGLAWAWVGRAGLRHIWVALVFLLFMIPLPNFLYHNLSQKLQLLSSEIGVGVIRWCGISVYLEGNVIDLGSYKLQVVEACNGLRYLFPLMSFGFLCAYLYKAPLWQRAVVFLATVPVTVLMNSLRIGVIGVMVDRWGREMADGFLHDFEGWVIFMACLGVLFALMWLMKTLSGDRRPFREVFGLELPAPTPPDAERRQRHLPRPAAVALALTLAAAAGSMAIGQRTEVAPERRAFAVFPMEFEGWRGRPEVMEQVYVDALKFTDYILADYLGPEGLPVNLYVAYYASQRAGESAHSPRSCMPGGGWEIQSLEEVELPGLRAAGAPLRANRALIQMGRNRQLVYYWFDQRGRNIANEYLVKWYLFQDALTRNRSDGALVRLVTPLGEAEDPAAGDARLAAFAREAVPALEGFVPD